MSIQHEAQLAFLRERHPGIDAARVRFNDDGWHNVIAVVDNTTVYRFARTDRTRELLRMEIVKLDLLRQYVTLLVPDMEMVADGVACYEHIPGEALYRHHLLCLPARDQDRIAAQLAEYLQQLHSVPMAEIQARDIGWFPGTADREGVLAQYEAIKTKLYPHMMRYTRTYVDQIFDAAFADSDFFVYTPTFVHGDLDAYHMCYDAERKRINGMIDYGVSGIGNPSHDVMVLMDYFGETFLRRIGKYLDLAPYIRQARFGAFLTDVIRAVIALDTGDVMWHLLLHTARDVMPVDSPWDGNRDLQVGQP